MTIAVDSITISVDKSCGKRYDDIDATGGKASSRQLICRLPRRPVFNRKGTFMISVSEESLEVIYWARFPEW